MFDHLKRDISHAARSLLRSPAFSLIAALTLALAIGANTAIFSVVDAVLMDPLDFPDANELVLIRGTAPGTDMNEDFPLGPEFYLEYGESARSLEDLAYVGGGQTTVRAGEEVDRLFIATGPPSLFSTLGVAPILGRLPTEDDPEGTVAVLSHWLWTDWFGRDPNVLGRAGEVSGQSSLKSGHDGATNTGCLAGGKDAHAGGGELVIHPDPITIHPEVQGPGQIESRPETMSHAKEICLNSLPTVKGHHLIGDALHTSLEPKGNPTQGSQHA